MSHDSSQSNLISLVIGGFRDKTKSCVARKGIWARMRQGERASDQALNSPIMRARSLSLSLSSIKVNTVKGRARGCSLFARAGLG